MHKMNWKLTKVNRIFQILQRKGKTSLISSSLNIPELSKYKYHGEILNQSIN